MQRDQGYAWVIVFAFFILEILIDGVRFSFGLMFVEFLSEFKQSKADTAWVGAIMIGVYNLSGPIFAVIVNRIGYRKSSILGSLIATTGFMLSFFATKLHHLYFTFGFLHGFGQGLAFLAGSVAVGRYFYKKRSLAFGISLCGSGVGLFVVPPLLKLLLEAYTWRGTMFILAGISLNGCVLATLYRPFTDTKTDVVELCVVANDDVEVKVGTKAMQNGDAHKNGNICNDTHSPLMEQYSHNEQNRFGLVTKVPLTSRKLDDLKIEEVSLKENSFHGSHKSLAVSLLSQNIIGSTTSFDYMFEKHSRCKLSKSSVRVSSVLSIKSVLDQSGDKFKYSIIENIFPKALVANMNFTIFMLTILFVGLTAFVPFSMLPDFAMLHGATSLQGAWLISAIGLGGTIGRVGAGVISDLPGVHRLTLLCVCFLVIGVSTIMTSFLPVYEFLMTYSMLYGIFFGAVYVVQPIVLFEYFGEQYIGEVMGIMMSVYGIAGLIGSPLAGWLFDYTGSYQVTFLTSGLSFLTGGIVNFLVLCTKSSREARRLARRELEVDLKDDEC